MGVGVGVGVGVGLGVGLGVGADEVMDIDQVQVLITPRLNVPESLYVLVPVPLVPLSNGPMSVDWSLEGSLIAIRMSQAATPRPLRIAKASYWFTKIAYIRIPESADNRLAIQIELKQIAPSLANPNPISIQQFTKEFCNSLLDFELRRQIEVETAAVRQLIVAKAFSESGVLEDEPPGTIADPVEMRKPTSLVQIIAPTASSNQ